MRIKEKVIPTNFNIEKKIFETKSEAKLLEDTTTKMLIYYLGRDEKLTSDLA